MTGDKLIRFLARHASEAAPTVRVFAVDTSELCAHASAVHKLQPLGALALARALTSGALLASLGKSERNINIQLAGDGPLGTVFVDANPNGDIRGYVSKNPALAPIFSGRPSVRHGFGGQGFVNVLRADANGNYFRGTVAIKSGEVDEDLTEYLQISEQVESLMLADAVLDGQGRISSAAGILIQALPAAEARTLERERALVKGHELYGLLESRDHWFHKMMELMQLDFTRLDESPVRWQCSCSDTRVKAALMATGVDELSDMIAKEGRADITCDFCMREYAFDRAELVKLRDLAVGAALSHKDPNDHDDN